MRSRATLLPALLLAALACAPSSTSVGGDAGGGCPDTPCLGDETCVDGQCVSSGCAEIACATDEVCISGTCYSTVCNGVACPSGDFCSAGLCITQACAGVTCPGEEVCVMGNCAPTSCGTTACAPGDVCVNGACVDAACMGITCPAGQTCVAGLCGLPTGTTTGASSGTTLGSSTGRATTGTTASSGTSAGTSGVAAAGTTGTTGGAAAGTTGTTSAAAATTGSSSSSGAAGTTSGMSISPPYTMSTFAGSGDAGFANGAAEAAAFDLPYGLAIDSAGNLYVADADNNRIRQIDPSGTVSTFAGSGTWGMANGTAAASTFAFPIGVAVDGDDNVYVGDFANNLIRKISAGAVSTLAGNGTAGFRDGAAAQAEFDYPNGLAVDASGNVYVADYENNRVRLIDTTGTVSTLAGNGMPGFVDGTLGASGTAELDFPYDVALNLAGNVIMVDSESDSVREIGASSVVTLAGNGTAAFSDGHGPPGDTAEFSFPNGIAIDGAGNIYIADTSNARVRKLDPLGNVTTVAGNGTPGCVAGTGGPTGTAQLDTPHGIATDKSGNIYVVDGECERVWVIR